MRCIIKRFPADPLDISYLHDYDHLFFPPGASGSTTRPMLGVRIDRDRLAMEANGRERAGRATDPGPISGPPDPPPISAAGGCGPRPEAQTSPRNGRPYGIGR